VRLVYMTEQVGADLRVRLSGEVEAAQAGELRDVLVAASSRSGVELVDVDLEYVTLLESTAIGALVAGSRAAADAGRRFRISRAQGMVRRALEVTGVLDPANRP
jgi:anti-anti-sigma factor